MAIGTPSTCTVILSGWQLYWAYVAPYSLRSSDFKPHAAAAFWFLSCGTPGLFNCFLWRPVFGAF